MDLESDLESAGLKASLPQQQIAGDEHEEQH